MLIQKLTKYINDNADFVIINRATSYYPDLINNTKKEFNFQCFGSHYMAYNIKVKVNRDSNISSSCSCPYDGHGICKHQVASINSLLKLIKLKKIDNDVVEEKKTTSELITLLPHQNGKIDREKMRQVKFETNDYRFGELKIESISKKEIRAFVDTYRENYTLILKYSKAKDEIQLFCSCATSKNCYHKYLLLVKVKDEFGLDYFSPDHEDMLKKEILEKENLLGKVDFDELFELEINKDGVHVVNKIENFYTHPKLIYEPKEASGSKLQYKPIFSEEAEFGLAYCIEVSKRAVETAFPIYGKLNKEKKEISSRVKTVEVFNLPDIVELISEQEGNLLPQAIRISESFANLTYSEYENEDLGKFLQQFKHFINLFKPRQIYLHYAKDSFAKKNLSPVNVVESLVLPILKIKSYGKFHQLEFQVKIEGKSYSLSSNKLKISELGILIQDQLYLIKEVETLIALKSFNEVSKMNIINEGIEHLREEIIKPYSSVFEISYQGLTEKTSKKKTLHPVKQVYLSEAEEGEYIVLQPIVQYGEHQVSPTKLGKVWLDSEKLISLKRNDELESAFLETIQTLHPHFEEKTDYFFIKTQDALASFWIMEAIEKLKEKEIHVFGLSDLKGIKYNLNKPSFSVGLSSGMDWFDMAIDIEFGDQKVDLKKLQKSILKNSNYVELTDGSLGILPQKWIEKYKKYFKLGQIKKDKIEISNFQFNIIDELYEDLENSPDFLKELYETKKRISSLKKLKQVEPSKKLNAELRSYQKEGLNWMVFLHENKLGGCLADDMGLGKTIQSIAFLQHIKDQAKANSLTPSLIVAPTSLMFNWVSELDKFAPDLNHLLFYGTNRHELKEEINKADVVLTTYGSLVKDIEFHKKQSYNYVILDESQAIKNPQSQRYKAVRLLKCENRLALTGTPIENNTFDLYSQFNFLLPGIFGSIKHFRTAFSEAIDKEQDEEVSQLLAKMINPFILRRTKAQVATELPSKTEAIIYCEMGKQQRKVYEDFKLYFKQKLQEQIEDEGVNKSQMYILQGLTKLRQICNSTALADKEKDYGNYSTKLDELTTHLLEKVNAHKVLVFSQFVGMLQLVKERLMKENIHFEYLDGQTRNREEKVTNFQQNTDVRVFLISLKAGGTGLNLTEADYVYLVDPWWNPAVESQAIDRCYRIGQDKKVMAYRMICKDSIEEKITALQDKKKSVASEVIRTDLEKKSFNKEDVALLFGK